MEGYFVGISWKWKVLQKHCGIAGTMGLFGRGLGNIFLGKFRRFPYLV